MEEKQSESVKEMDEREEKGRRAKEEVEESLSSLCRSLVWFSLN